MNAYYLPILEKNEKVLADQESVEEDTVSVSQLVHNILFNEVLVLIFVNV